MNKNPWFTSRNWNTDYRQTVFDDYSVGAGFNKNSKEISIENNIMKFNDHQYGKLPVFAVNIDLVKTTRIGWTYSIYGSVIEVVYPNGKKQLGIILDACGAARHNGILDYWQFKCIPPYENHIDSGVNWRFVRKGWNGNSKFDF